MCTFLCSKFHQSFDPFLEQKETAFTSSVGAMKTLAKYVLSFLEDSSDGVEKIKVDFDMLLEVFTLYFFF